MTHNELVQRAEKWLRNSLHCRVVFCELDAYTRSGEIPDAIGFREASTIIVECKATLNDFYADRKKRSRNWNMPSRCKELGAWYPALGNWRFYLTPPGLLNGKELPSGWGWYEVYNKSVKYRAGEVFANARKNPCISDWQSERAMLVSALARQQTKGD